MRKCLLSLLLALLLLPAALAEDWSAYRLEEPVTLTLMISNSRNTPGMKAVIDRIEETLNIKTELRFRPSDLEGESYVKSLLAMGEMADIFSYNAGALMQALNPSVYLVDLSEEEFASHIDENFKNAVSADGKLYGIPNSCASAGVWFYNKELHSQLGLELPRTWAELMNNCEAAQQCGITPVIAGYKDAWVSQLILLSDYHNLAHANPGWLARYNAGEAGFSRTPAAMRGFEKMYELAKEQYLHPDANTLSYEDACRIFAEGRALYMPALTDAIQKMDAAVPGASERCGLFGQPGDDPQWQGVTLWFPGAYYISNTSKHIPEAKLWMAYFLSDEVQQLYWQHDRSTGFIPLKNAANDFSGSSCLQQLKGYWEEGRSVPALEFSSPLKGANLTQITQECSLGLIPPEEAAKRYDEDIRRLSMLLNMFESLL